MCRLRTTLVELDNATLWPTYTMLSNLESVSRSPKTDLGLRPVFHPLDHWVEGRLHIISVLVDHVVHMLRLQSLPAKGSTSPRALTQAQRRAPDAGSRKTHR